MRALTNNEIEVVSGGLGGGNASLDDDLVPFTPDQQGYFDLNDNGVYDEGDTSLDAGETAMVAPSVLDTWTPHLCC